jgi:hypothetical protein
MIRRPQIALLPDGKRLHLQDGPIDLIVEAQGRAAEIEIAYAAAAESLTGSAVPGIDTTSPQRFRTKF